MNKTLGIAIIGCGTMGKLHASGWAARPDAKVRVVFDPDQARARELAANYDAKTCVFWQEAITHDAIDVVSICTPVCFHCEIAVASAKAGCHALCEKPIALSLDEADAMQKAADDAKVQLSVSYQFRGRSQYKLYRDLIKSEVIAGPVMARFVDCREVRPKTAMHRRSMNGGPIIDMPGHFFDVMRFITNADPISVYASGHIFGRGKRRLAGIEDLAIDVAEIQVRYKHGHVASVLVHWGLPEQTKVFSQQYLATANAMIFCQDQEVTLEQGATSTVHRLTPDPAGPSVTIEGLVKAIRGDTSAIVTAMDGRKALSVSLGALESIRTGSVVCLNEV